MEALMKAKAIAEEGPSVIEPATRRNRSTG